MECDYILEDSFQVKTLNWLGVTDADSRLEFLLKALNTIDGHDARMILTKVNHVKRRMKKSGVKVRTDELRLKNYQLKVKETRLNKNLPQQSSLENENPTSLELRSLEENSDDAWVVSEPSVVPVPPEVCSTEAWFEGFNDDQIVAFDVEFVTEMETGLKAGTVSVCSKSKVDNFVVHHEPGTFEVTPITYDINGSTENSLKSGKLFEAVKKEILQIFKGKIVVGCGMTNDLAALEITMNELEDVCVPFDLHKHFQKYKYFDDSGKGYDPEAIGLASLYNHYYGVNIQEGRHTADVDAQATLRLFSEVYRRIKKTDVDSKDNKDFSDFNDLVRLPRRKLNYKDCRQKQRNLRLKYHTSKK